MDLSPFPGSIVLFAWAGATQIAFGLAALVISLRYRTLVPLMLALAIVERALHALDAWVLRGVGPATIRRSTMGCWSVFRRCSSSLRSR